MKVLVTVEKGSDGFFWCRTENDIHKGYLTACGSDVEKAKEDLLVCLQEASEDFMEQGLEMPEIEFTYKYDLEGEREESERENVRDDWDDDSSDDEDEL